MVGEPKQTPEQTMSKKNSDSNVAFSRLAKLKLHFEFSD